MPEVTGAPAFLRRAFGSTVNGGGDPFTDDDDSILKAGIDHRRIGGLTKGCNRPTNERSCQEGSVVPEQAAAFLHRARE